MADLFADLLAAADELTDPRRHVEVCVVCPQLRDGKPREYERAKVCGGCRKTLARYLEEIGDGWPNLEDALERGISNSQRVSGGDVWAPLPFREDVWDLLLPIRTQPIRPESVMDQVGFVSIATVLDSWARDWADVRNLGEIGFGSTQWLAVRLDWACDEHPAIDDFAAEIRTITNAVCGLVGQREPRPQPCKGVPCRRCDLMTLVKLRDGSGEVECQNPNCRTVYKEDEYDRWTKMLAASVKRGA